MGLMGTRYWERTARHQADQLQEARARTRQAENELADVKAALAQVEAKLAELEDLRFRLLGYVDARAHPEKA